MIKTVIFDIGNVLAGFQWEKFYQSFPYTPEIQTRIAQATVLDESWNEFDLGRLSDEEIISLFVENEPELEPEIRAIFRNVKGMVTRFDYAIPWITSLKKRGYQVLVLSNFSKMAHKDCAEALDFLEHVDGGILSYQEQVIKPMPEIYQKLLQRYDLNAKECVFLDDVAKNLDGAAAQGIHTILFENREQAEKDLEKLLDSRF